MDRREFISASSALAVGAAASVAKDDIRMIPIVDTHQHLWDLKKFTLGWINEKHPLRSNFTPVEYAEAVRGLNVVKSVYMEVDVVPEQQQAEADYVIDLCKSRTTTMVAAVVSGRPAGENFSAWAKQFQNSPYVKGIRQVIHVPSTPAGFCVKPEFIRGVRLLGDLNLSYDLCIRPTDLPDVIKLVDECPGTRFILDHCGNGPIGISADRTQWKRDLEALAKRKNIVSKVSGVIVQGKKGKWTIDDLAPVINHTIDSFGWDRVMFGGDWPVCTQAASYREWVEALKEIVKDRKEDDQRKLFHDNAVKFYGLA
jgi:predicted TIM-barrel fold metal-dependent hydrolase